MRKLLASLVLGLMVALPASLTSAAETEEGFVSIFNGKNFEGWVGNTAGYKVEDGAIVCDPTAGGGNIYTEKEYPNFVLRFDFKLPEGANNGLGIRAPLEGNAAYAGFELQILDNKAKIYEKLAPYQYHGSLYGLAPAKRGFQKPIGEWNHQEVTVDGNQITVVLNGTTILDVDLDEIRSKPTLDGQKHPGLDRETGHIGFLGHGDKVEFKNLRIKELPAK
ncbi:DUF1080 domain-containing protein [Bremerella cremea]|uniref:3-keto-disaccharide hydrolase n=1 Tax=Bremerella cremea TaxID=1031537 RepID=UPI0031EE40A9